ncbi:hypothetical protein GGTG_13329 [Gaeumannomyces tritici R3-111a-1]|uniref:N-acetyltransferase domain-containing protein n=1 Tax=Gaeumannomyces tritici (strain R3-111a-1) TaxID=644352 RepID=J3PIK0_GAET3|nr:hypothetical protein GGTG_13329 [Gaeumannomyces tritici R3-111a-1]EJT69061.1 hypothetical protein GGTG_13329 [Gaeumannomyces tritici R3-111a-1]
MESIWEFRLKKLLSKCHVIVEDGKVIAFAVWTQESHFAAEQRDECPPEDLAEKFKLVGSRTDVFEKASAWIRDRIKDAGIQEWFTMHLLVTDRPFRCRGAAAMLLEEFVKEAGGGYCLVEASRMGEPQYVKKGFKKVAVMPVRVDV